MVSALPERPQLKRKSNLVSRALRLGLAFLTVLPVRFADGPPTERELAASRFAFPVIGLGIGLMLAGLNDVMSQLGVAASLAAAILLAAGVFITGGLHVDGLADASDGLFMPRGDVQRRLVVMRDPHVGTFGVIAIGLLLLGKHSALVTLQEHGRTYAVLAAAAVSRTMALVSAGFSTSARQDGTGRVFIEATTNRDAVVALVVACVVGALLAGPHGLAGSLAGAGATWLITRMAVNRLGGITGDILGAVVELSELAFLMTLGLLSGSGLGD